MSRPFASVIELACELVACPSVTPDDAGCQAILADRLKNAGFVVEPMPYGDVRNLWARRGRSRPTCIFAGHTDVVPPGPLDAWASPPFQPNLRDGRLYGRGSADMKGGLAAMVVAAESFVRTYPQAGGSIAFLLTSDEEGPAHDGTRRVVENLVNRNEAMDFCVIGEASSRAVVGDTLRHGRRGSLNGYLTIHGIQGHVAYPELADNPVHRAIPALQELCGIQWDHGDEHFPPTQLQIANVHAGTGATNVIPGGATIGFNFRFSPASPAGTLKTRTEALLAKHDLKYRLDWELAAEPFLTTGRRLIDAAIEAVRTVTGLTPELSTTGGTSDGRFIAPTGIEVIELGPVNATIHKVNECVATADLEKLAAIYFRLLELLFGPPGPSPGSSL